MKFLHTSDWHLGVKTNGRDRLTEQKKALEEILSIANFESVDAVLIAGDIFNTSNPSAEAEELFFDMIEKFSDGGERFVFVLAGNHDDPTRIEAGLPLASKHNIALVGDLTKLNEKTFRNGSLVQVIETGKGYIKIQKGDEVATIAYLPYPSEARISEKLEENLTYSEKVKYWAEIGSGAFSSDTVNIFVSHLFMVGSKTRQGEVKVGDSMAVPVEVLPEADYVALGHLHTPQKVAKNCYYSGAINALSVNQSGFGVNIVETSGGVVKDVRSVKLQNISRYETVRATSIEDAEEKLSEFDDHDLVELIICQNEPLSSSAVKALKRKFACVSNIALERTASDNSEETAVSGRRLLGSEALFKAFYKSIRGVDASEDLVKMFNLCKGEEDETN